MAQWWRTRGVWLLLAGAVLLLLVEAIPHLVPPNRLYTSRVFQVMALAQLVPLVMWIVAFSAVNQRWRAVTIPGPAHDSQLGARFLYMARQGLPVWMITFGAGV